MPAPTCLINSTRHEYLRLATYKPDYVGFCIKVMENRSKWNARHDDIYVQVRQSIDYFGSYTDITDKLAYYTASGGEIIHETFELI
jgi:hypothetical protein